MPKVRLNVCFTVVFLFLLLFTPSFAQTHSSSDDRNAPSQAVDLAMGQWRFVAIGKTPIAAVGRQQPYLKFEDRNNTVTGFTGCNRLNGAYRAHDSSLAFDRIAMTKMACTSEHHEDEVLKVLESTTHFAITGDELRLLGKSEILAVLIRPHEEQTLRHKAVEK